MAVLPLRIQHQSKVGGLDAAHECAVRMRLELDGSLVYKRIDVVGGPVAITLDAQTVTQAIVFQAALVQIGRSGVDRLEDLELHRKLRYCPGVALVLDQLLDLCFEVGDLLLVVVLPTDESTAV